MSDINIIEEYRALMTSVLKDRMADDERVMWLTQLAEMRAGYQAGMWVEEKMTGVEQAKPDKGRLVWCQDGGVRYLAPEGAELEGAYYCASHAYIFRYPDGGANSDIRKQVASLAEGLRVITDMARADGFEVPDHPDAAPATIDALTLPPGLTADDGWIPWGGGACPCRDWPEVEYVTRDGYHGAKRPKDLLWEHNDDPGDIIAYRRFR